MKIADILNIGTDELRSISLDQLERIVKQAQNASIRRLNTLQAKDMTLVSPAYDYWNNTLRSNAQRKTRKNRMRLISELRQNQRFLSSNTSLVGGAREYRKKMQKLMPNVNERDYAEFWAAVDAIRETNRVKYAQLGSSAVVKILQAAWDASKSKEETNADFTRLFWEEYNRSNAEFESHRVDPDKFRPPV